MTPVLRQHWDQATAARAMGVSRRTIRSWCRPTWHRDESWQQRPALLAPDPEASARDGRPMYRIADVVDAERAARRGRTMRRARLQGTGTV